MMKWQNVLDFWFAGESLGREQITRWWKKSDEVDADIRRRFASLVDDVYQHLGDKWSETPEGRLSAIICLDQFPRNMFRNTPGSFKYDGKALALCKKGLQLGHNQQLPPLWQTFFLMPLMHSESLEDQDLCMAEFSKLAASAEDVVKDYIAGSLTFAEKHREIIRRFKRYPHRNAILQRASSAEEEAFLLEPGSSF